MTNPTPIKPQPQRELYEVLRYRAAYLSTIMRQVRSQKLTGSVTLNMNQGNITGLEVKMKVSEA